MRACVRAFVRACVRADELATAKSSTPEGDKDSQVSNQLERCRADLDEAREILSVVEVLVVC